MKGTISKFKALWIEDDPQQASFWRDEIAHYFDVKKEVTNDVDALKWFQKHARTIDVLITDLRIKSGPYGPIPPTSTPYVYGIELIVEATSRHPETPVVAYSRFVGNATATRAAVDQNIGHMTSLLNVYGTPLRAAATVKAMHADVLRWQKERSLASGRKEKYSLTDHTRRFPPQVKSL